MKTFSLVANGNHYYTFIHDRHGDVNKILDETGAVVSNYQYDAYGNEIKTGAQTTPFTIHTATHVSTMTKNQDFII